MPPNRHDLLRLSAAGWRALLTRRPDLPLHAWAAADHPVIARRPQPADPPGHWAAAVARPPTDGRTRLAFTIHPDEVAAIEPPPLLRTAAAAAPAAWRQTLARLADLGDELGMPPRLFGSLMWQHLTARPYLTAASDLDLLWTVRPETRARLPRLLRSLVESAPPPRLDGEIVFAGIGAVQWRELAAGGDLLLKTPTGVALISSNALLS